MSCLEQSEQIEYEKMMLDDVVSDIKQVIVTKENLNETSKVVMELDNYNIKNLQEADDPNRKNSIILQQFFQKTRGNLMYDGKTKIRSDVLNKLKSITDLLLSSPNYPLFTKKSIESFVKEVLVDGDNRVISKYVKSINDCLPENVSYYTEANVKPFVLAVDGKLIENDL